MRTIKEYLNDKGTTIAKPTIDGKSMDTGPSATVKPLAAAVKGKNWEAQVNSKGKDNSYIPSNKPIVPKGIGPGLANDGDKKLIYNPKIGQDFKPLAQSWPKTNEEINKMSIVEFSNYIEENSLDLPLCNKNPVLATNYVANLAKINENVIKNLIHEMKRAGCLEKFIQEALGLIESVDEPAEEDEINLKPRKAKTIKGEPMNLKGKILSTKK